MKEIYLDHSSTTPVDSRVVEEMMPYLKEFFGNPLSPHQWGEIPKKAIEKARLRVANLINAFPDEIIFTATGSESNNLALKGVALAYQKKGKHLILSSAEHESVWFAARALEKMGFEISFLKIDRYGMINPDEIHKLIRKDTILVAVIHASHEIGTIQPIIEIGRICREKQVLFFSDGIATIGLIPVDVKELNLDLMSFAGNMFYGPKGSAGLYIRQGIRLEPLIHGGKQENYIRSGTHNVPGIVGLGKAAQLARDEMSGRISHMQDLRDRLGSGLFKKIERVYLTGHPVNRLPHHLSFCIEFVEGEALLLLLELEGNIAGASGSLCGGEKEQANRILLAMGLDEKLARGALRFSLGKENRMEEIHRVIEIMPSFVDRLRKKSKAYQDLIAKSQ